MRVRFVSAIGAVAVVFAVAAVFKLTAVGVSGQAQSAAAKGKGGAALKTPWGDPDLQGIWTDEFDTPLQRNAKYGTKEFFTDAERKELDDARIELMGRDKRVERGTELDVAGAYNAVFNSFKRTGRRTSLVVDPPNGRIPERTPEAAKDAAEDRAFRVAMLQATETCKSKSVACAGGKYDPTPSPRREERAPKYNVGRMNRHFNPEDGALADRCMTGGLPEFGTAFGGSFRRIVQTPGGVTMFYDFGQGQGFQRNIVMNGSPHLPPSVRQWWGDSRGHWEGNTLVIDVTNFGPKVDFQGSRENLHLVERWTRTGANTLEYEVKVDDPTVWKSTWTVKQEFSKQSEQANRIYYEPRCYEGNIGYPSLMKSARLAEKLYSEGKGPHPATADNATDFVGVEENPLQ